MTEAEHLIAIGQVYATTFELAAKIGQNAGWAYARALKQVVALNEEYMDAQYQAYMTEMLDEMAA